MPFLLNESLEICNAFAYELDISVENDIMLSVLSPSSWWQRERY